MNEHPDCPISAEDLALIDAALGDISEAARALPEGYPDGTARDVLRAAIWLRERARARGLLPADENRRVEYEELLAQGLLQVVLDGEPLWAVVSALDDLQDAGSLAYPARG